MRSEATRAQALLSMLEAALGEVIALSEATEPSETQPSEATEPSETQPSETTQPPEAAQPSRLPPFEARVVADALETIEGDPSLPTRDAVRVYLRPGRRFVRVFWTYASARDNSGGSILHFVERSTGKVFVAKSAKKAGVETGRQIRPASAPGPVEAEEAGVEVWEPHRVVWFRTTATGTRRVELRLGTTAWVSFGQAGKGFWASVNGLSKAKRQLKMGTQWVDLPFVYTRDEVPAPIAADAPAGEPAGTPLAALLEGLRTRKVRKLQLVSTDASPHVMRVERVLSQPGSVVVEGTVKRSKAKLTIATDVDAQGRPTTYARLRKGTRELRVDARRIVAPALEQASDEATPDGAAPSEPPTPSPRTPPARGETAHQRQRRERAERRAGRLERAAEAQHADARGELAHIPMGQPILVGHHSERRHRKAIERSDRKTRRALETARAAEAAKSTAARAGYAISSDDPEALPALEARLAALEEQRAQNKAMNVAYRKGGWDAVAKVEGVTPAILAQAKRVLERAPWLKAPADLKNLGANVRRVRKRIEELRAAAEQPAGAPIEGEGFAIEEDPDANRVRFRFEARPDRETIAKVKREGFRWSRRHGAWQRQLNRAGRQAARRLARELFGWEP